MVCGETGQPNEGVRKEIRGTLEPKTLNPVLLKDSLNI